MWPRYSDNAMYMNYGSTGFHIRNNSSLDVMFMTPGGNVGIGNIAPAQKLDVTGNMNASGNVSAAQFCLPGAAPSGGCITTWPSAGGGGTIGGNGSVNFVPRFTPNGTTLGNSTLSSDGNSSTANGNFFITGFSQTTGSASANKFVLGADVNQAQYLSTGADGADFTNANMQLSTWWGIGLRSSCGNGAVGACGGQVGGNSIVFDARLGNVLAAGWVKATAFLYSSDRRLKKDIAPLWVISINDSSLSR